MPTRGQFYVILTCQPLSACLNVWMPWYVYLFRIWGPYLGPRSHQAWKWLGTHNLAKSPGCNGTNRHFYTWPNLEPDSGASICCVWFVREFVVRYSKIPSFLLVILFGVGSFLTSDARTQAGSWVALPGRDVMQDWLQSHPPIPPNSI